MTWPSTSEEGVDQLDADVARLAAKANCLEAGASLWAGDAPVARHHSGGPVPMRRSLGATAGTLVRSAWQHELAVRAQSFVREPVVLRVCAYGLPVLGYYALYNAIRALCAVQGTAIDQHAALQKFFAFSLAPRLSLPWSARVGGDPDRLNQCTVEPAELGLNPPSSVNPVAYTRHSTEELLFAGLRMARRWTLDAERRKWLANNLTKQGKPRKQLTAPGRIYLVNDKMWPTTLLDFFYGMRVRVNYQQADDLLSKADDWVFRKFHDGVTELLRQALLLVECNIATLVGIRAYESLVAGWKDSVDLAGAWASEPVSARYAVIESYGRW